MILVTGATGHLGEATIDFLLRTIPANMITALVRDEQKAERLLAKGVSPRVGDYYSKASLLKAFEGVEKVLLVSSNDFNDRYGQHRNVIDAAKAAGVKHLVYTGAAIRDIEKSPIKAMLGDHFETEKYLIQSGLTFTILRNNLYAEVIPMFAGQQALNTGISLPAGDGRVAFVSRHEIAEAAAVVLSKDGHENRIYEITGTENYSYADIAGILSELSGKTLAYTKISPEAFKQTLAGNGVPEAMIGFSLGFALAIAHGDFEKTSNTLEQLIGRKPKLIKPLLKELYQL